jgi:hypothetical protein
MFGSVGNMFVCKRCHEIIAVVVVRLESYIDPIIVTRLLSSLDEVFWKELALFVEIVSRPLCNWLMVFGSNTQISSTYDVNEDFQRAFPLLHQFCCIVLFPYFLLVIPEVSFEGLLSPWTVNGVGNWRKG